MDKSNLIEILHNQQNKWKDIRSLYANKVIDLTSAQLKGVKFSDLDLRSVDFSSSNLSGCVFKNCNLSGSIFNNARLDWLECNSCNAGYVTVHESDLYSSRFEDVDFTGSELIRSNLSNAGFSGCNLKKCDFRWSTLTGAMLDSRKQLKGLIHFLSDEQLSGIIFSDESKQFKSSSRIKQETSCLKIRIDGESLTPFNLSYMLLAIEGTYNNLLYLSQATSESLDEIRNNMHPYYQGVGAEDSLKIRRVSEGSVVLELAASSAAILLTLSKTIQILSSQILEHKKVTIEEAEKNALIEKTKAEADRLKIENIKLLDALIGSSEQQSALIKIDRQSRPELNYLDIGKSISSGSQVVEDNKEELIKKGLLPIENILFKYERMGVGVSASFHEMKGQT